VTAWRDRHRRVVEPVALPFEHAEHERRAGLRGQVRHLGRGGPVERLGELVATARQQVEVVPAGHELRSHHQLGSVRVHASYSSWVKCSVPPAILQRFSSGGCQHRVVLLADGSAGVVAGGIQ
jgi:hypothetical protein